MNKNILWLSDLYFCFITKQLFVIIILVLTGNKICSQVPGLQQHDVKFSFEIEAEVESQKIRKSSAAYYYTYIGEYEQALNHYELPLDWGMDSISAEDSLRFLSYHPVNAFEYLADRTAEEQIVIISEAHQKPQHRIFTRKLLRSLYDNGYRLLGIESMTPKLW